MPKISRNPIIINDLIYVNASSIVKKAQEDDSMILRWYSNNEEIASMRCQIIGGHNPHTACFIFHSKAGPECIEIEITTIASNLGIGKVPFFVCPITKTRCRRLYLVAGRLASRLVIKGALYDSQVWSKKYRELNDMFGAAFLLDDLYDKVFVPYFKPTYRNAPTRSLNRITRKIANLEGRLQDEVTEEFLRF
jgi:hypothetical protein